VTRLTSRMPWLRNVLKSRRVRNLPTAKMIQKYSAGRLQAKERSHARHMRRGLKAAAADDKVDLVMVLV
jgi:hypothetical protein